MEIQNDIMDLENSVSALDMKANSNMDDIASIDAMVSDNIMDISANSD